MMHENTKISPITGKRIVQDSNATYEDWKQSHKGKIFQWTVFVPLSYLIRQFMWPCDTYGGSIQGDTCVHWVHTDSSRIQGYIYSIVFHELSFS